MNHHILYYPNRKTAGELLPDQSTEPYPLKRRTALGMLGSCSQIFRYVNTLCVWKFENKNRLKLNKVSILANLTP